MRVQGAGVVNPKRWLRLTIGTRGRDEMVEPVACPVRYEAADIPMVGTIYHPEVSSAARGAVLIFPEAPGPGAHVHGRARRLAQLGYVAMVADLHGEGRVLRSMPEVLSQLGRLRADMSSVRLRALAALGALRAQLEVPVRTAAIGYCFGGKMALDLGRHGAELDAIVGFHCALDNTDLTLETPLPCPVLVCVGAADPSISMSQRTAFELEMRARSAEWAMHIYGNAVHAFTDVNAHLQGRPDFARYHESADNESWESMLRLFSRTIDRPFAP